MNPIFYLIDGARYGVIGVSDSAPGLGVLVVSGATLVLCLGAWAMLKSGYRLKS
jgi:ABC-2 type transport system permease protein